MVGVGFESDSDGPACVEKVTLSPGQKRELAGVTGLVMASTVFFLTPLVLSAPEPSLEMAPLERTAVPLMVSAAAHAPVSAPAPAAVSSAGRSRTARAQGDARVRRAAPLAPPRGFVSSVALNTPVNAAGKAASSTRKKVTSNGLVRALVGSGRYRVQPFPSPLSE